jgi:putative peptidoglycan lipid II flippase
VTTPVQGSGDDGGTRALAAPSAVMASGTIVSRVTGILRDVAMTAALGFYLVSDAYSLGNALPTVVYILVIGGALNAVFIPQLVRRMKEDSDGGKAYADRLLTFVGVTLVAMSIIAVLAAPLIVDLYTPADYPQSDFDLAVAFARLCLPQILFYGVYTMLGQVLNARGHFGVPMFAPIANNIIAIATFLLFIAVAGTSAAADGALTTNQILILGIGTTLGVVVQALILVPVLMRSGYSYRPRFDFRNGGLGKAGGLAAWTIALVLINQAVYVVITRLATQANVDALAAGAVAAGLTTYQKAHLVFMLPHSVITVSVVTALLPALSRYAHDGNRKRVGADIGSTMRVVSTMVAPIASVLFVIGASVAVLLFGYGAATEEQASLMGQVVSVFMLGLLPFTLFYVLLRGFYALEDTRTPFFITVAFSAVLLVLVYPLFYFAAAGGVQIASIALAYSISYWVGLVIAWWILARRLGGLESRHTAWTLAKLMLVSIISIVFMVGTQLLLVTYVFEPGLSNKFEVLIRVIVISTVGFGVFFWFAWLFKVSEVSSIVRMVTKRIARKSTS